ncbi:MAG TPA: sulfurtransferase TusA family protein [Candidatus Lokiarchaeia archaeon]|nr:sulfurtransferase TusA family protein [Candidatus Lokiarchaeia archaeon]
MVQKILDTSGTVCPMPAFNTRRELKKLEAGDELVVTGDFLPAIENITRIARKEGWEVVEQSIQDKIFQLKLQKA